MKALFTILFFTVCFTSAYAQESGYVIKLSGDTVICSIENNRFGEYLWKTDAEKNWKNFEGIMEVHLDQSDITYYLRVLPDSSKAVFFKLLEKGTIQLYEHFEYTKKLLDNHIPLITWYMSKGDHFHLVPVEKNKTALLGFLADKPEIMKDFKSESYNDFQIKNVIHLYNTGRTLREEKEAADAKTED